MYTLHFAGYIFVLRMFSGISMLFAMFIRGLDTWYQEHFRCQTVCAGSNVLRCADHGEETG